MNPRIDEIVASGADRGRAVGRRPNRGMLGGRARRLGSVLAGGLCILAAACAGGCSGQAKQSDTFSVAAGSYQAAFDASREVLREARFELDRIDAASGIITTMPKTSAGLLTPWEPEQSGFDQEVLDATSTHRRRVRVSFEPVAADTVQGAGTQVAPASAPLDLRQADRALSARVEVFVDRVRRPGWRLETESIRQSTTALDPSLRERAMVPEYATTVDRDDRLAGRLAARIRERMERGK